MQKHQDNLASRINGNALQPLSGVTVTVVNDSTGLPAALYSDNGVTPVTSIVTDDNGGYSFYAADGKYTITYSSARLSAPITRKLIMEDPDDNPSASLAQLSASGGGALVSTIASGTGAVARNMQAKLRDIVNIKDFGASTASTNAQNKVALQLAITALNAANGGVIVVDYDICYGVKTRTPSTWPDFTGTTKPIIIQDSSRGFTQDPLVYPASYDGAQYRLWANTPQTTSPGQHDGNVHFMRGSWNPGFMASNDSNLAAVGNPARTATDNRRATYSLGVDGAVTWGLINGTTVGAGLTNEELSNFGLTKFSITGDTLGDYSPLVVERKTGSMAYGLGTNAPAARHHFGPVAGSPNTYDMLIQSATANCQVVYRTSAGSGQDIIVRNNGGTYGVNVPSLGDAFQVDYLTRRTWVAGSLQLRRVAQTYGATVTIDTTVGNIYPITATNGTAFTIAAPLTPSDGMEITITISNTSGGALGAVTWNAVFKMAAWVSPATGFNRSITFYYNGTNWVEKTRTAADIPN